MEKIAHLWNVNQFVTKLNSPQSKNLQIFYIESCKKIGRGMCLPNQNFGPATMCSYCGTLWSTVDYKVRIMRGKQPSKSVKKIIRKVNASNEKIPKIRATLGKKSIRNQMNTIVIKCSVCSKCTKLPFTKPKREKSHKLNTMDALQIKSTQKRKKKKNRDRTAGLNISGSSKSMDVGSSLNNSKEESTRRSGCQQNFITPTPKLKKLNINRLKDIVNKGVTPPKTKSLHSFLKELC